MMMMTQTGGMYGTRRTQGPSQVIGGTAEDAARVNGYEPVDLGGFGADVDADNPVQAVTVLPSGTQGKMNSSWKDTLKFALRSPTYWLMAAAAVGGYFWWKKSKSRSGSVAGFHGIGRRGRAGQRRGRRRDKRARRTTASVRAHMSRFGSVSKACSRRGFKPGTKQFGACMKAGL